MKRKKTFFLVLQVLLFRQTKQTSKNVGDATMKGGKGILHDQYILERYSKLGAETKIIYAVVTIFMFARFLNYILGVTNFFVEKTLQ